MHNFWLSRCGSQHSVLQPSWSWWGGDGASAMSNWLAFCYRPGNGGLLPFSDSVTRVNDSTRVTLKKIVTRLESLFHRMTRIDSSHSQWLETRVSHFYKISEFLMDKPSSFAHKEWALFASVIIKIGGNFLFCLSSRAMLHIKGQASPTCAEGDLRLCFH